MVLLYEEHRNGAVYLKEEMKSRGKKRSVLIFCFMVEESISCLYVDDDKLTKRGKIIIQEGVDYWNEVFGQEG